MDRTPKTSISTPNLRAMAIGRAFIFGAALFQHLQGLMLLASIFACRTLFLALGAVGDIPLSKSI
jgi:hypothetical protein